MDQWNLRRASVRRAAAEQLLGPGGGPDVCPDLRAAERSRLTSVGEPGSSGTWYWFCFSGWLRKASSVRAQRISTAVRSGSVFHHQVTHTHLQEAVLSTKKLKKLFFSAVPKTHK